MSRNYLYLFTSLLLGLFHVSTIQAVPDEFPVMGGTTSDGIVVVKQEFTNFKKSKNANAISVVAEGVKSRMAYKIIVPQGKEAQLSYKLLLNVHGGPILLLRQSTVSYKMVRDGQALINTIQPQTYSRTRDNIRLTAGTHIMEFEVSINARPECSIAGIFSNMTIHVHQFGDLQVSREPICGKAGDSKAEGEAYYECSICGRRNKVVLKPKFTEHKLVTHSSNTHSCLDNQGEVTKCERCPYTKIQRVPLKPHKFSAGVCTVCGLKEPMTTADGSVYVINSAEEMRVLSELVSTGDVKGNIGIDIRADLVFDKVPMLPLGTFTHPFSGVLNGNGHRISGVNCTMNADCMGFVGVAKGTMLSHAVIANLIFDSGNSLKGANAVAGIVGHATCCDIMNCASFGSLEGNNDVAGIVGFADQQVSIVNCAAVNHIYTQGNWHPLACRMPVGQILNSYGATTPENGGKLDPLANATLRHCFTTHGDNTGITRITKDILTSYEMEEWLKEESDSIPFKISAGYLYPVPVVDKTVVTMSNGPVEQPSSVMARRADSAGDLDDSGKSTGEDIMGGYVDENAPDLGKTVDEIMREDYLQHEDYNLVYAVTRSAPEGAELYMPLAGGELQDFTSYLAAPDSAFLKMREYEIVAPGLVTPIAETVNNSDGLNETIDEYDIRDGKYSLVSRISFENDYNIIYQEPYKGLMKTVLSVETSFDDDGNPLVSSVYSHNLMTGEVVLESSYTYPTGENIISAITGGTYEEYVDSETNTVHVVISYTDSITNKIVSRNHLILRGSDNYLLEVRAEKMVNGQPFITDGMYLIYDDEGCITQAVCYGPVDKNNLNSELRPYLYEEYFGHMPGRTFPTAIQVPTKDHQSLKKQADPNVYDMQGRVVRRVTDAKDPFSGLQRGLYIYQGSKYLKR